MVTDSESLFLDNGLIRKHLLEFVARCVTARQARRDGVSRAGCGMPSAFTFFGQTGFVDGLLCPSASPRILLLFYPARN